MRSIKWSITKAQLLLLKRYKKCNQQETTYLNIPCLTIRENTERPFTITKGTNVLVGVNPDVIIEESLKIINGTQKQSSGMPLWDGKTAERIVDVFSHIG